MQFDHLHNYKTLADELRVVHIDVTFDTRYFKENVTSLPQHYGLKCVDYINKMKELYVPLTGMVCCLKKIL